MKDLFHLSLRQDAPSPFPPCKPPFRSPRGGTGIPSNRSEVKVFTEFLLASLSRCISSLLVPFACEVCAGGPLPLVTQHRPLSLISLNLGQSNFLTLSSVHSRLFPAAMVSLTLQRGTGNFGMGEPG